jgi:2-iminobutanoate/2-iminopropanoate deaminase
MIMERKVVASPKAPKAVGTYSQAVIANGTIYVSGQLPIDGNTGEFVPGGIKEQLHQVFKNLQYVLEEGGYTFADVVKTNVYLSDMGNFAALNEVYALYFKEPYPARVAYQVAALPKAALVEIDVIAAK